ncbi:MAG: ABC transporter ATP-binding protein [Devosia sp.]|uniref:ABC transporter ATP-binding protein n=1 Tax=Devosia sp. 66-22 TaxID=1895753 RepID=UPI00092CA35A|nr:ABC transporter ATP-binding protein [Devosia sp. 66-22]MBN9344623.1 ABC transporter ATP-binding protein [Devosia sp.]OJX50756.1 MAG: ABC transporter ATP-binding protein [Devosia sp. 66-22]
MAQAETIDAPTQTSPLLDVRGLSVTLTREGSAAALVDDVSFSLAAGEILCIVGESGCGKTVTARSIIGLNRTDPRFTLGGRIDFDGTDLLSLSETQMRGVRGAKIAMIFQDPMTSLNPLHRIGAQIGEVLRNHTDLGSRAIRERTIELLAQVGIPYPGSRIDDYPHQFSGGMRQRAMIALALACSPSLLIADEPTTALDVTTQKQILSLIDGLRHQYGMAVVLITHDLGVVAGIADRVMVMYAGQCVEAGAVRDVFRAPQHPYTAGLLASIPAANRVRTPRLPSIKGAPPVLTEGRPAGCAFRPRCEHAFGACVERPGLEGVDHLHRCWLPEAARAHLAVEAGRVPA